MWLYVYWCWDGDKHVISIQDWYCERSAQRGLEKSSFFRNQSQTWFEGTNLDADTHFPVAFLNEINLLKQRIKSVLSEDPPKPYIYNIIFRVNIDTTHFPQTHNVYMYIHIHIAIYIYIHIMDTYVHTYTWRYIMSWNSDLLLFEVSSLVIWHSHGTIRHLVTGWPLQISPTWRIRA